MSFELSAGNSKIWVTPNATGHIEEYVRNRLLRGVSKEQVDLITHVRMSSLSGAVDAVVAQGVSYHRMYKVGEWELIFRPPREPGLFPALVHAAPLKGSS